jgi:hypothetical protein
MFRAVLRHLAIAVPVLLLPAESAFAQEFDPDGTEYARGALPPTDEERARAPRLPLTRAFLPELIDLSSRMPAVGQQGRQGSCTAWAVAYAARSYYSGLTNNGRLTSTGIASPAYIYGLITNPAGKCQSGSSISDAMDLLVSEGAASLKDMPYSERSCPLPSNKLRDRVREAGTFQIERFIQIYNNDGSADALLDKIKTELARGHPVVTSVNADRAFDSIRGRTVWHRKSSPHVMNNGDGWHAITLVGYNEKGQYFKFINSWGRGWGDRGFGRLSYKTVVDHNVVSYSMRVAGVAPPQPEPAPDPDPSPDPTPPQVSEIKLPEVSCGLVSQQTIDGKHMVSGFVREQGDLDKIRAAIGARDVKLDIALRPWPQCEALMTLRDPLKDTGNPAVNLPSANYAEGDTLSFKVGMAPFEGYLHVAYVQADGNVVNLVQQGAANLQTIGRGTELTFGDGEDGRAKFTVSEPYGKEMVIAIASASPLFPEPRPTVEVERTFLTALRAAILARPDPNLPERRISAAYAVLETKGDQK